MSCTHYYSSPQTHTSPFEDGCEHPGSESGVCTEECCPLDAKSKKMLREESEHG